MKQFLILLGTALAFCSCAPQSEPAATRATDRILAELRNPASKNVVVVSHRGDWRNWPENSLDAIESVIGMGVDVMELDLKLTKDSVLVLCHDKTIDRTTNGHGRVCDITYDSIQHCVLRTGHGVKTDLRMPTLRDALKVCKDRIVVNIDQGYEYYDLALAITEELGVTDQVLIKGKRPAEDVAAKFADHPVNMMYMPIIDILKPQGRELFEEYRKQETQPLAYEVCWDEYTPEVETCMEAHRGRRFKTLGELTMAIALRRTRRRSRFPRRNRGSLRTTARDGGDDHPDRPSRTADPISRIERKTQVIVPV